MRTIPLLAALMLAVPAGAITMGWTLIGNPGNTADPEPLTQKCGPANNSPCGSVVYTYYISRHEVTNAQYSAFLNAVAASDPNGLFNDAMGSDAAFGGISRSGSDGEYTYAPKPGFGNKPVNYVSFYDALRFANWLENGQPSGPQGPLTTEAGTYAIADDLFLESGAITRDSSATFAVPSDDEWYKAAYYHAAGDSYFDYPTGTDTVPKCVDPAFDDGNSGNCLSAYPSVTDVGAYSLSDSPYGTFDQGGNVWEWDEGVAEGIVGRRYRGLRGGAAGYSPLDMAANYRGFDDPRREAADAGFRLVQLPTCGNGQIETGEQCDDGNTADADGCSATCQLEICGNKIVDAGEACDDGNFVSGDGCDANCTFTACGNGIVAGGEQCDDGNDLPGDGCDPNCTQTSCGNNIVTAPEECDDGNAISGDGCDINCTATACGNGVATAGEACDDGNTASGDGCDSNCTPTGCPNGVVTAGEQCDDGNKSAGDGCRGDCTAESCGDNIQDPGEECDDGNTADGDGCSSTCVIEPPEPEGTQVVYNFTTPSLWDATGDYQRVFGGSTINTHFEHHADGRLTGARTEVFDDGNSHLEGAAFIRGRVFSHPPLVGYRAHWSGSYAGTVNGTPIVAHAKVHGTGVIAPSTLSIIGEGQGRICVVGIKCTKLDDGFQIPLPAGMIGTWSLTLTVKRNLTRLSGHAELVLSNGRTLSYIVGGKYKPRDDSASILLRGTGESAKSRFEIATTGEDFDLVRLRGKVLGQKLNVP